MLALPSNCVHGTFQFDGRSAFQTGRHSAAPLEGLEMNSENILTPYGTGTCFYFPYPGEIKKKIGGCDGILMPMRNVFEMFARENDNLDPKSAAFFRDVASHYPHCDSQGHGIDRNGNGAILYDYDDWDAMSVEEKELRGSCNAAIAVIDRLRFELEMMDNVDRMEEVNIIRRTLADLIPGFM